MTGVEPIALRSPPGDAAPPGALALDLAGARLFALPSGALWRPAGRLLAFADLHLGKSDRLARLGGALLPPYETAETLARMAAEVARLAPREVVCLGDSFDDPAAADALAPAEAEALAAMMAGRRWVWIAGNHDPAPLDVGGTALATLTRPPLTFRHQALAGAAPGEVSGHFHPKARVALRGRRICRPCFVADARRLILPAFGAYTGGLDVAERPIAALVGAEARALLLGRSVTPMPFSAMLD